MIVFTALVLVGYIIFPIEYYRGFTVMSFNTVVLGALALLLLSLLIKWISEDEVVRRAAIEHKITEKMPRIPSATILLIVVTVTAVLVKIIPSLILVTMVLYSLITAIYLFNTIRMNAQVSISSIINDGIELEQIEEVEDLLSLTYIADYLETRYKSNRNNLIALSTVTGIQVIVNLAINESDYVYLIELVMSVVLLLAMLYLMLLNRVLNPNTGDNKRVDATILRQAKNVTVSIVDIIRSFYIVYAGVNLTMLLNMHTNKLWFIALLTLATMPTITLCLLKVSNKVSKDYRKTERYKELLDKLSTD